ncbi:hypothetical protein [Actinomycetospora aeridis]|uniref:Secreted protein n=1 Tax=Actinomycetospora aeridis TaxID=3129231 RepID=A0ABU8NDJ2_9PSEU
MLLEDGSGVVVGGVVVGAGVVVFARGAVSAVGQLTGLDTPALGTLVQVPAVAETVTVIPTPRVVVVVRVVDVVVTVLEGGTPRFSVRVESTVYCPAPLTAFQLTGIVAVVTRPLVAHVMVPIVTPVGALMLPALAVAVPALRESHAAAATPLPASSSVTTTAATAAVDHRRGRVRRW